MFVSNGTDIVQPPSWSLSAPTVSISYACKQIAMHLEVTGVPVFRWKRDRIRKSHSLDLGFRGPTDWENHLANALTTNLTKQQYLTAQTYW